MRRRPSSYARTRAAMASASARLSRATSSAVFGASPPALDHAAVGAEPSARWVAHPPAPRAPADEAHAQRGVLVVHVLTNVLRLGAASRAHVEPRVGLIERLGAARDARDAPEVRHPSFPPAPAPPTVTE